jgi:hypothetical protein
MSFEARRERNAFARAIAEVESDLASEEREPGAEERVEDALELRQGEIQRVLDAGAQIDASLRTLDVAGCARKTKAQLEPVRRGH